MDTTKGIEMLDISDTVMGRETTIHPTLVWDDQTVMLVDTGYPGQLALIQDAFKRVGVPFERLNTIVLTHQDIDHIGGAGAILKALPGQVSIMAFGEERAYINGEKRPLKLAQLEDNLDHLPEEMKAIYGKLKTAFENARVDIDETLTDGEVLPCCGGVQVIHTPGHTTGHICLYHRPTQTLIAGDTLAVQEGQLLASPPSTTFDMALLKQSLKKLSSLDIKTVICYHGGAYSDHPNQRIAALSGG